MRNTFKLKSLPETRNGLLQMIRMKKPASQKWFTVNGYFFMFSLQFLQKRAPFLIRLFPFFEDGALLKWSLLLL